MEQSLLVAFWIICLFLGFLSSLLYPEEWDEGWVLVFKIVGVWVAVLAAAFILPILFFKIHPFAGWLISMIGD